jgi:phage-related protein
LDIVFYQSSLGVSEVILFIEKLPKSERGRTLAIFDTCQHFGLSSLNTRQIAGKIWEIKTYRHNRFFYFRHRDQLILFYALKKQKPRLQRLELDLIHRRYHEAVLALNIKETQ